MTKEATTSIDAEVLMRRAIESAQASDFGELDIEGPLREHLAAAARYFDFTEIGRESFAAGIVNELVNRLRMAADLKANPAILQEDVSDPIVIFGLPRTGSTKLQRMMSADPANEPLLYWKMLNFAPFPEAVRGEPDPRIELARAACDQMATAAPEIMKVHPTYYDQAEEEAFLVGASYEHFVNNSRISEARYCEYIRSRPPENAYRFLRTVLQYLQWQGGGRRGPWILKAPTHLGSMSAVRSQFPNATFVQTHRDPPTVFASLCHLIELASSMYTDDLDLRRLGREQLDMWRVMWERNEAERAELPGESRFLDVDYHEIKDDPFTVIERIYAMAGRKLSPEGRAAMEAWQEANGKDRHGKHEYRLEDYGVDRAQVEEAFRLRTPLRLGSDQ